MPAYYNEIDPFAAQWLRNLINAGLIAAGEVDERSIADVRPADLAGFDQCHFFAGIGGWPYALQLAGWPDARPVWTGSCPCQPFSGAGKGKAGDDERHLWPSWASLIAECRPSVVFGEQVEAAIGWGWLDLVFADLEAAGYACGATVLPACSVGAPHIRQRVWLVAERLDNADSRERSWREQGAPGRSVAQHERELCRLADAGSARAGRNTRDGAREEIESHSQRDTDGGDGGDLSFPCGATRILADATNSRREPVAGERGIPAAEIRAARLPEPGADGKTSGMADAKAGGREGRRGTAGGNGAEPEHDCGLGNTGSPRLSVRQRPELSGAVPNDERRAAQQSGGSPWAGAEWIVCRDGKARPVEPGIFPLASGLSARVGRLRAAGNSIVPQVAAEFIAAYLECCSHWTQPPCGPAMRSPSRGRPEDPG